MNSNLLKATITKNGDTMTSLAEEMGMPVSALSLRVSGKIEFRRSEIKFIKERYHLSCEEVDDIFFVELVSA